MSKKLSKIGYGLQIGAIKVCSIVLIALFEYMLWGAMAFGIVPFVLYYMAGVTGVSSTTNLVVAMSEWAFPALFTVLCLVALTVVIGSKGYKAIRNKTKNILAAKVAQKGANS